MCPRSFKTARENLEKSGREKENLPEKKRKKSGFSGTFWFLGKKNTGLHYDCRNVCREEKEHEEEDEEDEEEEKE